MKTTLFAIGDSLSTGFALGTPSASVVSARVNRNDGWFNSAAPEIRSLALRLGENRALDFVNLATVSAQAAPEVATSLASRAMGTKHLPAQVEVVCESPAPAKIVLVWIGHNDLDFAGVSPPRELRALAESVSAGVLHGALRIAAAMDRDQTAGKVFVLGLIDFQYFFTGRDEAGRARADDPGRYPFFEHCYRVFPSMRPEHRQGMIDAARLINARLRQLIEVERASGPAALRLEYSDALHSARIDRAIYLSDKDAWHPSPLGRRVLADAADPVVRAALSALD